MGGHQDTEQRLLVFLPDHNRLSNNWRPAQIPDCSGSAEVGKLALAQLHNDERGALRPLLRILPAALYSQGRHVRPLREDVRPHFARTEVAHVRLEIQSSQTHRDLRTLSLIG